MYENLDELKSSMLNCRKCKLCKTRQNVVFGVGNPNADVMFIGEGPGGDEDRLGEPFVGKAGQLMNKAFDILEINRKDVYYDKIGAFIREYVYNLGSSASVGAKYIIQEIQKAIKRHKELE